MFSLLPHRMAWGDGQPSPYKGRRLFPFDLDKLGPLLKINCEHSDSLAFPKQFRKGWGLIGKDFADLHYATFREREEFTPSLLIREMLGVRRNTSGWPALGCSGSLQSMGSVQMSGKVVSPCSVNASR